MLRDREICLERIAAVRSSASDPETAYLIRLRIKRAILTCQRAIAKECGVAAPVHPGYLLLGDRGSVHQQKVAALSNEVFGQAEKLCQPSEALDARWKAGWSSLSETLEALEQAIDDGAPPLDLN
jgi:hypothetical protein